MRMKQEIIEREIMRFAVYLRQEEREPATIEAYLRATGKFAVWLNGRAVTKGLTTEWKAFVSKIYLVRDEETQSDGQGIPKQGVSS